MSRIYNKEGVWYFDKYFDYLNKNISKIPKQIRKHILNLEKYLFDEEESLYDSKLIKFNYDNEKKVLLLSFLASNVKNKYDYRFEGVEFIRCSKFCFEEMNFLLTHEFSIDKEKIYKYRFVFIDNAELVIWFHHLKIRKRIIKK